jgi:hypothetical protein
MVRRMSTSHWMGIGLTVLCLGTSGCCCADKGGERPLPSAIYVDRLSRRPTVCDPCAGYHPTRWISWPDCCETCPPPDQSVPSPRGSGEFVPPGESVRLPEVNSEVMPVPQEEPRPKIAEPPKADEPPNVAEPPGTKWLPKAKEPPKPKEPGNPVEPPKAKDLSPKAEEPPLSPAPLQSAMSDFNRDELCHSDWGPAPLPEQSKKSSCFKKEKIPITPISGCALRILDPYSDGEAVLPAFGNSITILVPKKGDVLPEIRLVTFRQEVDSRGDDQRNRQQGK